MTTAAHTTIFLLSGGGFAGAFQVPILHALRAQDVHAHFVFGVSVGALNGILYAQNNLEQLDALWASIHDDKPLFGINGFMSTAVQHWRGLYSLAPLEKKVKKLVSREKLDCVFGAGVTVRETGIYQTLQFSGKSYDQSEKDWKKKRKADDTDLHLAIMGSSAIAGLMESYTGMVGGRLCTLSDGGHRHVLPPPPVLSSVDHPVDVYAIFNRPIMQTPKASCKVDSLPDAFAWAIETQMHAQMMADYEALKVWAGLHPGRRVSIYAPLEDTGSLLDASKEAIARRMALGKAAKPTVIEAR